MLQHHFFVSCSKCCLVAGMQSQHLLTCCNAALAAAVKVMLKHSAFSCQGCCIPVLLEHTVTHLAALAPSYSRCCCRAA